MSEFDRLEKALLLYRNPSVDIYWSGGKAWVVVKNELGVVLSMESAYSLSTALMLTCQNLEE